MIRSFGFVDLPHEIRFMIYEQAVTEPEPIKATFWSTKKAKEHPLHYARGPRAFIITCRTVRDEATATFYRLNDFEFSTASHVLRFFRTITPVCFDSLRGLSFTFTSNEARPLVNRIYTQLAKQGKLERLRLMDTMSIHDCDLRVRSYGLMSYVPYKPAPARKIRTIHQAFVLSGLSQVTVIQKDPERFPIGNSSWKTMYGRCSAR